ncbi:MAG: endolytic transglycosylase MltG [Phycicoccus sp.]|nr:endolytic transglycosylase MltG [Phycicoccus sp.]NMM33090.1 endolytic transglycosylase MltG [Phycicoccus sp.]
MRKRHLETSIFGDPEHDPEEPHGRASADSSAGAGGAPARSRAESRRAHRRKKGRRRIIVLLVALSLVVGAGAAAILVLRPLLSGRSVSNDYDGAGSGAVTVVVHSGDATRTIAAALENAGVVKSAAAFLAASAADPRSGSIQPGTYSLRARMSAASSLAMLLDPANRKVPRVTIREGLWVSEIIRALSAGTGQPLADYTLALEDPAMLGLPAAANGNAEGYLFPASYEFDASVTAADQLHAMVAKSLEELDKLGVTPDKMQRVLTIASIVEAEAGDSAARPKVARVIENRLAKQMPLQLDSTVSFVAKRRGKITTTNAERASRSPYNTYLVAGLPPGPIDSPGLSAIEAALHPASGPWLYFVAVNPETGETRFAIGPDGHAANVKLFQKWCSDHPGKC